VDTTPDIERIRRIVKQLETVPGSLEAGNATRHILRHLDAAARLAEGLTDVWDTVDGEDWDRAKVEAVAAEYRAPEVPTANWLRGQGVAPIPADLLQAIRDGNEAQPNMAVTALLGEVDRLAYDTRRWRFNYDTVSRHNDNIQEHWKRTTASTAATLARVWRLVDRKRKTVQMDALRKALQPEE
jgi:hypothetical protein